MKYASSKFWLLLFVSLIFNASVVYADGSAVGNISGMYAGVDYGAIISLGQEGTGTCNGIFRVTSTTPTTRQQWIIDLAKNNFYGPNKPVTVVYTGDSSGWWCEITDIKICNSMTGSGYDSRCR